MGLKAFKIYYMQSFRAFKHRNFKLLFIGQAITLLGTWLQRTAVVWLIYRLTNSAFLLGLVGFVSLIPSLVLGPLAGNYVERKDGLKLLKYLQALFLVQAAVLAVMVYLHIFNVPIIIFLVTTQGITNAYEVTCRQALMADLIDDKADLPNAIALNSTIINLTRVVGPAIAGVLLAKVGEGICFLINALSFIPFIMLLNSMKLPARVVKKEVSSAWDELKAGYYYVRSDKEIWGLLMLLTAVSFILVPFTTLLPIFAKDIFDGSSGTFGLFEGSLAVGSVIAAVYMARLKNPETLVGVSMVAVGLFSVGLIILAFSGNLHIALFAAVVGGCGMMGHTSSVNTYIQTHARQDMRSRAISYFVMAYMGISPLGCLLLGEVASKMKPREVVILEAFLGLVSLGIYAWYRTRASQKQVLAGSI